MRKVILAVSLIFFLTTLAIAGVNLKNEDSQSYDIKVHQGSTTSTSINGGTTANDRCSGDCKIEIVGGDSIEAKNGETVIIKNGKLSIKK
ncbi:MAG: hypothetical protein HQK77_22180 [Desulfobacterales bacterium]|nr:hypothetical protein [Desulfobacterales bacterium]